MNVERFKVGFISRAAQKEYDSLDGSVRVMVDKGLLRLALRADEIGKPLSGALAGCKELKFRANGIRLIYRIRNKNIEIVQVIAIGPRSNGKVFEIAARRITNNDR